MRACPVVRVQCRLWSLKLGLAFWSCALLAGPVHVGSGHALSLSDLWPFTTPPPLAWQSPVQSVNDPGRHSLSVWRLLRWTCSTHAGSGLCGCVINIIVCLLVLTRHCLWTSSGLLVVGWNFLENGPPRGTGWCSSPASSPLNVH